MSSPIFGVGDQTVLGWGDEGATPGTAVAVTAYVPLEPGQPAPQFNPARGPVEIAAGSPNTTVAIVDRKGSGTWQVRMKLYPTLGQDFLTKCGLTSGGIVAPSSLTLQQNAGGKSLKFPGARATRIVISASIQNDLMVDINGVFTGRPVAAALLAAPSIAGEDPFIWTDLGAVTLVSGATTTADLESFTLTIELPHADGYGNSGVPLANILKLAKILITGQLQAYFNDTNVAEYNAMIAAGGTAGALSFPFVKGGHSVTIALPHAKYSTGTLPLPAGGLDLVQLSLASFSPTLANQLTYTAA